MSRAMIASARVASARVLRPRGGCRLAVCVAGTLLALSSAALAEVVPRGSSSDTPPPPSTPLAAGATPAVPSAGSAPTSGAAAPIVVAPVVAPPLVAAPPAAPSPKRARSRAKRRGPRPAASGFQASFGSGVSAPVGNATGAPGDSLAARYAWQVPLTIDLGMKASERAYVGVYLQLASGSEGSDRQVQKACNGYDSSFGQAVSCDVTSLRFGVSGEYSLEPDAKWNPWVGYGIGLESVTQTIEDRRYDRDERNISTGLTFAKVSFGATYRGTVGLAPFIEVVASQFMRTTTQFNGTEVHSGSIDDPAQHAWILVGLKVVVNP